MWETKRNINENLLAIYPYGSRVYGCDHADSDYDFMAVADSQDLELDYTFEQDNVSIHVVSEALFIKKVKECHISYLECIFQREDSKYREYFELNLESLRRNISGISSNSFVKCKKKLAIGEDYIGRKSMFHSIRILMFGIQIAKYGKILDYSCANHYLETVMALHNWDSIKAFFQPIYNSLKSEFKLLAPLEGDK
ncbi:nucleotidyltransferase [Bacillus phage vB_BanS-Thrax1]|nr:nucleotidyltransferase [Bacillus phage vB_BanS-Thrax1]